MLCEKVEPMSLHVGLVRIASGSIPLVDILYDPTDRDRHLSPFCHLMFINELEPILATLSSARMISWGRPVRAF
jgi:hypothetical protein